MSERALWPLHRDEAIAATGSALLFALAFPPAPFVLPALCCLVPAGVAIARAAARPDGIRDAARIGFWFGVLGYAAGVYWIAPAFGHFTRLAVAGYLAIVLAAGMLTAAGAAAICALRRASGWPMALVLPVGWVGLEVLFANLPQVAFPWLPLGLATAPMPVLAQFADVSGVRGLSFVIASVNGLAVDAWLVRGESRAVLRRASAAVALVVLLAGYGAWRMATTETRAMGRVAVVQPNIAPAEKWDGARQDDVVAALTTLTRSIPRTGDVSLVVWPEAALPGVFQSRPDWRDSVRTLVREVGAPILFGMPELERREGGAPVYFNSAMLTSETGELRQAAHRKRDLVPVIERAPFAGPPWPGDSPFFGGYSEGRLSVFAHPMGRIGALICYESIFAGRAREIRREGGDLIVSLTNDAWFGRTTAPWQHASHLVMRAIENRIGIVRSANSGVSGYVDPVGRVHGRTALFVPATRIYETATTDVTTPYVRFGDWIGTCCALITLAGIVLPAARARIAPAGLRRAAARLATSVGSGVR